MRVVVVGTSGSGKTAMAKRIASALDLRFIELDRLHWEPNWEALTVTNPDEFVRRVGAVTSDDGWVCDGNYGLVRDLIWRRATNLVWLDYSRAVVMYRVIKRSVARAFDQTELWAGNREDWRRWLRPSHPNQMGLEHVARTAHTVRGALERRAVPASGGTATTNSVRRGNGNRSTQNR